MLLGLVVLLVSMCTEVVWTLATYATLRTQPVWAGVWSVVLVYFYAFTVNEWLAHPVLVHWWAAGVGLGAFGTVLVHKERGAKHGSTNSPAR